MAESAEAAFRFVASLAQDEEAPTELRLQAAKEVMSRAWGKPRLAVEIQSHPEPVIDRDRMRSLFADPEACRLASELDARLAQGPAHNGHASQDSAAH
jgi:hypothetical protein